MTEEGNPTTSTIHTTITDIVTALTARDDDPETTTYTKSETTPSDTYIGMPTGSFTSTKSDIGKPIYTNTKHTSMSSMTTVTMMAAREEAVDDDSCTPAIFRGGGFCIPTNTKRDVDHKTHTGTKSEEMSSHTSRTGMPKPTGSFTGTKSHHKAGETGKPTGTESWTKTGSGMTTVTMMAARVEAADEDSCTPVIFHGGGFCLSPVTKRDDLDMTHAHTHTRSHLAFDTSPANTKAERGIT